MAQNVSYDRILGSQTLETPLPRVLKFDTNPGKSLANLGRTIKVDRLWMAKEIELTSRCTKLGQLRLDESLQSGRLLTHGRDQMPPADDIDVDTIELKTDQRMNAVELECGGDEQIRLGEPFLLNGLEGEKD